MGFGLRRRFMIGRGGSVSLLPFTDEFTRADGDLANGWEYTAGRWTVSSNAAAGAPGLGSELVTNGNMELDENWSNWGTPGTNERSNEQAHGGTYSRKLVYGAVSGGIQGATFATTTGGWYVYSFWSYPSGNTTKAAIRRGDNGAWIIDRSRTDLTTGAWNNFVGVYRETIGGSGAYPVAYLTAAGTIYIDDYSIKLVTLADTFCTPNLGSANVDISVPLTLTAGTQAGAVVCLDSATTPANFIIAYHDGTNANLVKCVAGTYTSLIASAAAYAAGRVLRVVKSGNSVDLYYNSVAIGTTQTVGDTGITNNTRHGLFSTYASNTIASFTAA